MANIARRILDTVLLASWVLGYAALVFVFRILRRLERRNPQQQRSTA
jgi:hypothetical protein